MYQAAADRSIQSGYGRSPYPWRSQSFHALCNKAARFILWPKLLAFPAPEVVQNQFLNSFFENQESVIPVMTPTDMATAFPAACAVRLS